MDRPQEGENCVLSLTMGKYNDTKESGGGESWERKENEDRRVLKKAHATERGVEVTGRNGELLT